MSSRSKGVMKVWLTRRTIACVVSSALCSASRIRCGHRRVVRVVGEHLGEQSGTDDEVSGLVGEQVVEGRVDRAKAESHKVTPGEAVRDRRTA